MASPFDRLMTTIHPHLPGAVDNSIRQELFMACHDFFRKSDVWREEIEFELKANVRIADIMPFSGRIERLLYVTDDKGNPVSGAMLSASSNDIIVMPFEATADTKYIAVVSLTVTDPVSRDAYPIVPHNIVQTYTEELMHGTLARMMAQPNKPYTNTSLAQYYLVKANSGAARAKNAMKTGNTEGSQNWRFPQTFNRS